MAFPQNMIGNASNLYQAERFPPSTSQVLIAGTAIAPNGNVLPISAGSAITLTGTPTITTGFDGQEVTIVNVGSNAITFQDKNVLTATTLLLAARSTLTLRANQAAKFLYSATLAGWVEIKSTGFSGCRVYNSAPITITNNTATFLTFDTERFDTDSYHSVSAATGNLVAPAAGYYLVGGCVQWDAGNTGRRACYISLNGTTTIADTGYTAGTVGDAVYHNPSCIYKFVAGDFVELGVYHTQGVNLNIQASLNESPEFWMCFLGS